MSDGDRSGGHLRLYLLLLAMVSLWGANFVVARLVLRELPALLAASLRAMLAGLLLIPVYLWRGRALDRERWTRADLPGLLLLGLVGVAMNQLFFLLGLGRTSTSHASILAGMMPLVVLMISTALGLERLTGRKLAGMLLAVAGVGVLQLARSSGSPATLAGDALIAFSITAFAMFTVLGKQLTAKHGAVTINTFAYVGGGLMLLPVAVWFGWDFDFSRVTLTAWLSLLYMAVFPSVVCYLIYYYALTRIPASRVSAFSYLQPLIAILLGMALLGENFSTELAAGGALVLTGVFMTERG